MSDKTTDVDESDVTPDFPIDPVDPTEPDLNTIPDLDGQKHVTPGVIL